VETIRGRVQKMSQLSTAKSIAVIGGTGKEGKGLAYRWAKAGYRVLIGSRSAEKAQAAANEIADLVGESAGTLGMSNQDAARQANVVVLTVPYAAHRETLESIRPALQGKLLIDATVPLEPGHASRATMPPAGSAAQESKQILGEGVEVAAAFHSISYEHLLRDGAIECDVLVTGTSRHARSEALELVGAANLNGWDAGSLENSAVSEGLASVLIHINKQYGSVHAGIRVTGVERQ
jgi:NADPH-dependent F420 reductase